MQKWRNWEAAGKADWLLALKRESVIAPLAVQPKVGVQLVDEAALELGLGRSVIYELLKRYAFCTTCIAQQRYVHARWEWAFPALLFCHVHKSPLRHGCPMCGEDDPLPFGAPAVPSIRCWSCGANLTDRAFGSHVWRVDSTHALVQKVYRAALRGTSPDYALLGDNTAAQFRCFVDDLFQLLA
jgi:hypothetical protein